MAVGENVRFQMNLTDSDRRGKLQITDLYVITPKRFLFGATSKALMTSLTNFLTDAKLVDPTLPDSSRTNTISAPTLLWHPAVNNANKLSLAGSVTKT